MDNFVMKSENSTAQIKCTSDSTMHFYQSQSIHITNLEFIGCGGNQVRHVEEFVVEDTKFEGKENSSAVLELIETTAQIVNSTFVPNRKVLYKECATFSYACGFFGGAIIATNSTVDISRSRFEDNKANVGGAIFAEQDSIINVNGSVFVSNSATNRGGGVLYSNNSTITIEASEFYDNGATYLEGGVLYSSNSTITIEASEFYGNSAHSGGVLASISSTIRIKASEIYDNKALSGGVLYSYQSTIKIEASEFHNNIVYDRGGAIILFQSNIFFDGACNLEHNHAENGGAIHSTESRLYVNGDVTIAHNIATGNGGGVYLTTSKLNCQQQSNFGLYNNTAVSKGGGLHAIETIAQIVNTFFVSNGKGECVWSHSPLRCTYDGLIGGAIIATNSTLDISRSRFEDNRADLGGAIFTEQESIININGSVFDRNGATHMGGGVLYSNNSTTTINASAFHRNYAWSGGGGVLDSINSTITIEASEFHYNDAWNGGGGGGVLDSSNSTITIEASEFNYNNAWSGEGGIPATVLS